MHINTTVTREYYAQERYYTSASKGESFLTDQVNDLNGEEEIVRDHGKTKTAADIIEMFENLQKAAVDRENEKPDKDWRYMSDEEWDKFIEVIDEKIEDMQESVKEEVEKNKETSEKQDAFENADILTARYTSFVRRNQVTDPDTGEVIKAGYVDRTFYTREGIISTRTAHNSKEGTITDKQNWKVDFKSDEDYERTMKFLDRIPEEDNSPFTTREAFWKDYLNGEIDEDEFIEYYETLDHGIARFIKTDENGNNYVDKEMTHSKYFKYFGLMQFTTISEEELQRGLELSALKDRGFDHYSEVKKEEPDLYTSLREAFAGQGKDGFRFYGEEETFSLDDWVNEIIRRAHLGLMDSLFMA